MGNEAAGQQVSESASQRGVAGLDPCGGADGTCGAADARGRLARAYTPSPPIPPRVFGGSCLFSMRWRQGSTVSSFVFRNL